jgi:hypothetical protein
LETRGVEERGRGREEEGEWERNGPKMYTHMNKKIINICFML